MLLLTDVLVPATAGAITIGDKRVRATVGAGSAEISVPAGTPAGVIVDYGGTSAPSGWLLCDGSAVSRSTYADLFTAIATAYGVGDGSTTFNLPDFRGRVAVGLGTHADVNGLGDSDGMGTVANRRPKHRHTVNDAGHVHDLKGNMDAGAGGSAYRGYSTWAANSGLVVSATTGITVGNDPTNDSLDAPAYLVANKIIKT